MVGKLTKSAATPTVPDNTTVEPQCDASGNLLTSAVGNVASGATDSGNPVKVGGVYNSTLPTLTNGQRGDLQLSVRGGTRVLLTGYQGSASDSVANTSITGVINETGTNSLLPTWVVGSHWNGASWDRNRGNTDLTILASAARTVTVSSSDLTNYNGRGVHVVLDVTNAGTGSVTITISGKDALGGLYYTLLTGAAVTTVSTNVYKVYPGLTAAANAAANDILPRTWRVTVTHNNANSITYSVSASVIL